ncbi:MAG: class I SAM-dependent methyltransferase [Mariprofundus sp.]|nr:class I SAM-dependent methyltransferase [Mariprofundus sp.]
MNKQQRKRIIDKHRDSLTRHGYHPNALYWSNQGIQQARFKVLAGIGIQASDSVLDVGCGFGDFKGWSESKGCRLKYTGIDLSTDLLKQAEHLHPDGKFCSGDLFDMTFGQGSFDWVILSGALNEQLHDDSVYAFRVITRMYSLCRKGVAFNMLDARHLVAHDLHSQMPERVLAFCQGLCPNCVLHDEYLNNDFSIYMLKTNRGSASGTAAKAK